MAAAWPEDRGETPTARAIQERLVKIRQNSRAAGAGHFGISSAQSKTASSLPETPHKQTGSAAKPSQAGEVKDRPTSHSKRKRAGSVIKIEDDDDDDEVVVVEGMGMPQTPRSKGSFKSTLNSGQKTAAKASNSGLATPTKSMRGLSVQTLGRQEQEGANQSPTKRPRRTTSERQEPYDNDGVDESDSDVSDYVEGYDGTVDEDVAV